MLVAPGRLLTRMASGSGDSLVAYYVDADDGDDGNDGTSPAEAWATMTHAADNVPESGFRLYCKGEFRESNPSFLLKNNFEIVPYSGETEFQVNGYVIINPATVGSSGGDPPYYTFNPGEIITGMAYDYHTLRRFNARPDCFFRKGANAAFVQVNQNYWFQDLGTLEVTFNPDPAMIVTPINPAADYVYFRAGNFFRIGGCSDFIVRDLTAYGCFGGDETTGVPSIDTGYGVLCNSASGTMSENGLFENPKVFGYGGHGMGAVTSQKDIEFRDIEIRTGIPGITGTATAFVFHSNAGNPDELTGDLVNGFDIHMDARRDINGVVFESGNLNGLYTHGGDDPPTGDPVYPTDVEFRDGTITVYDDTECTTPFGCGVTIAAPVDDTVVADYPVRYISCTGVNLRSVIMNVPTPTSNAHHVAFQYCRVYIGKTSLASDELVAWTIEGTGTKILREACTISYADDDLDSGGFRGHTFANTAEYINVMNLFYNVNPNSAAANRHMYTTGTTFPMRNYGNIWMHGNANAQLIATGNVNVASFTFDSNWYFRLTSTTGYNNGNASFNSQAEWQAGVDPNGVYATDPQLDFTDIYDITPTPGGAQTTTNMSSAPALLTGRIGINGATFSGKFGPWQ